MDAKDMFISSSYRGVGDERSTWHEIISFTWLGSTPLVVSPVLCLMTHPAHLLLQSISRIILLIIDSTLFGLLSSYIHISSISSNPT